MISPTLSYKDMYIYQEFSLQQFIYLYSKGWRKYVFIRFQLHYE
jgi:hypothetical protein